MQAASSIKTELDSYSHQPKFYMLIGVPGAGKSTFIKNCYTRQNKISNYHQYDITSAEIISTDQYIENWANELNCSYNDVFKDAIKLAEKFMTRDLLNAIRDNQNIVWDQTNISSKVRKNKLSKIPDSYYKVAIFFDLPQDLDRRLASRPGKIIPQEVMQNMTSNIELPSYSEGFNEILVIGSNNESYH